jgi:hypothetical protein
MCSKGEFPGKNLNFYHISSMFYIAVGVSNLLVEVTNKNLLFFSDVVHRMILFAISQINKRTNK